MLKLVIVFIFHHNYFDAFSGFVHIGVKFIAGRVGVKPIGLAGFPFQLLFFTRVLLNGKGSALQYNNCSAVECGV